MTWTPEERRTLRNFVGRIEHDLAATEFAAAADGPHVVVAFDPSLYDAEHPESIVVAMSIEGVWPDFLTASQAAEASSAVLNDGDPAVPFVVVAVALAPRHVGR